MESFQGYVKMRQQNGHNESIEDYEVLDLLGKGGFACVYRARCRQTGFILAIKMIDKIQMNAARMENRVKQEVAIHAKLKHTSILQLYTFFEDISYVYLVLELAHHGELQRYLKDTATRLTEIETANIIGQVVKGLLYLHSQDIIHRDMSLSNLLLTKDFQVKIADFGLATLSGPNERHTTLCGTPNYISPEVASRATHGRPADVWGLGCMLYTLLVGTPPFDTGGIKSTLIKVVTSQFSLPTYLSAEAKDLLNRLLQKNPMERIRLDEVLVHPFMTRIALSTQRSSKNVTQASTDSGVLTTMSSDASRNFSHRYNRSRSEERYRPNGAMQLDYDVRQQSPYSSVHRLIDDEPSEQMFCNATPYRSIEMHKENCGQQQHHSNFSDNVLNVIGDFNRPADPGGGNSLACMPMGRFLPKPNSLLDAATNQPNYTADYQQNTNQYTPLFQSEHHAHQAPVQQPSHPKQISVPAFCTDRLLPTRHKTKNAILTIESDGSVVIEFFKFKSKYNEERIIDVCRISRNGQNIIVYQPNGGRGHQIQDHAQPLPAQMSGCSIYTYDNLPSQHWKKYMYAARFIELVRNKTPKVTLFSSMAKCQLMETQSDFEAFFYGGEKITKSSDSVKAHNEHGLLVGTTSEQLFHLWPAIWTHFQECLEKCLTIEKTMNTIEIDGDCFPIIVGRRPITLAEQGIMTTNQSDQCVRLTPRTPRMPSFAMSVTSSTSSSAQRASCETDSKTITIPGIGSATKTADNVLHINYSDNTKLSVLPKEQGGGIKYTPVSGTMPLQYTTKDVLPDVVRHRLEQVPNIVKHFLERPTVDRPINLFATPRSNNSRNGSVILRNLR